MIADARVFRHEYRPEDLVHRHDTLSVLSDYLDPITRGRAVDPVSLFGPTGVGKTAAAELMLDQLRQEVLDFEGRRINCWTDHSRFDVLRELLEEVGAPTHDLRRDRTARDAMLERFREHAADPCMVVLDEVDQLDDADLLYDLYNTPGVSLVLIANREDALFGDLDDRLQSRLVTSRVIHFDPYGVDELVDILRARADRGLEPGAVGIAELRAIADRARGDARVGIQTLKNAAEDARLRGADEISLGDVETAVADARREILKTHATSNTPSKARYTRHVPTRSTSPRYTWAIIEPSPALSSIISRPISRRSGVVGSNSSLRESVIPERHRLVA